MGRPKKTATASVKKNGNNSSSDSSSSSSSSSAISSLAKQRGTQTEACVYLCLGVSNAGAYRLSVCQSVSAITLSSLTAKHFYVRDNDAYSSLIEQWCPIYVECVQNRTWGAVISDVRRSFSGLYNLGDDTKPLANSLTDDMERTVFALDDVRSHQYVRKFIRDCLAFKMVKNPSDWSSTSKDGLFVPDMHGTYRMSYSPEEQKVEKECLFFFITFSTCEFKDIMAKEFRELGFAITHNGLRSLAICVTPAAVFAMLCTRIHQAHRWPSSGMIANPCSLQDYHVMMQKYIEFIDRMHYKVFAHELRLDMHLWFPKETQYFDEKKKGNGGVVLQE